MTFQIEKVAIYSFDGRVRELDFAIGRLNIVTGASRTGKSALLEIVDYCLASKSCRIPVGVIRDHVKWFSLVLRSGDAERLFVARMNPGTQSTTESIMLRSLGSDDEIPTASELSVTTNRTGAIQTLSRFAGVSENSTEPAGTRASLSASIRHCLYFMLQKQGEIASPEHLFHSQGEEWSPQAIRDVLPYFLGAVDQSRMADQERLRRLQRRLVLARRSQNEHIAISGTTGKALALLREARQVGLAQDADFDNPTQPQALSALARSLDPSEAVDQFAGINDEYAQALQDRLDAHGRFTRALAELRNAEGLQAAGSAARQSLVGQQVGMRLVSVMPDDRPENCLVCGQGLDEAHPSMDLLRQALAGLDSKVTSIARGGTYITREVEALRGEVEEARELLARTEDTIRELAAASEQLSSLSARAEERAVVRGRIALYLDSVSGQVESATVAESILALEGEVAALLESLESSAAADSFANALARVNVSITTAARALGLGESHGLVRLDPVRLTIVAETEKGAYRLDQMGSGANWVGYHVASMICLHEYFSLTDRPVPRSLWLDQPSQAYYPPDFDVGAEPGNIAESEDSVELRRLLKWIHDRTNKADGAFQVILIDHADLPDEWFQNSVIARWRDGVALVPESWVSEAGPS